MEVALFAIGLIAFVALCAYLGREKTHGADHDATGTRNLWPGG